MIDWPRGDVQSTLAPELGGNAAAVDGPGLRERMVTRVDLAGPSPRALGSAPPGPEGALVCAVVVGRADGVGWAVWTGGPGTGADGAVPNHRRVSHDHGDSVTFILRV